MPGFSEVFYPQHPNYAQYEGFREYLKRTGATITSGTFEPLKDIGGNNKNPGSHSMENKDHPFPDDPVRDMKFRLAEQGAVRVTQHAADPEHAFQGRRFAPLGVQP